jgi:uncharacterized protein with FMN-binding domain
MEILLDTYEQHSRRKLIATVLAVVVIAGIVILADHLKSKRAEGTSLASTTQSQTSTTPATSMSTSSSNTTSSSDSSSTSTTSSSSYKDGSYSASSSYFVPHGDESIKVSVTLKSGTISDVSIVNSEGDPESAAYQQSFASSYKSFVVGQKISSLQLSVIAGASDTTQAFADALSQIASKAQA